MKLTSFTINNFRSIRKNTFNVIEINGTNTYSLIGINESGKSSFLNAISLVDNDDEKIIYLKDFFDENSPVSVVLNYQLEDQEKRDLAKKLTEKGFEKDILSRIIIKEVAICCTIEPAVNSPKKVYDKITFEKDSFEEYTLQGDKPVKKEPPQVQEDLNLNKYFDDHLSKYFWGLSHQIIFWKSSNKYLINEQINLDTFATDPDNISIPLTNCFRLAGISKKDIPTQIAKLKANPAEISNLQDKLGDKVTSHIKKVWPDHPIRIKFQINSSMLLFFIEDEKVKYRSKTVEQRSDGFRQFVSFLLTISAENATNQLSNSLLLLDEPETHLHPQAQEYLKEELIKITKNNNNNIVFFATHSNYMVDKDHIERCFRVFKSKNKETKLESFDPKKISYSEVNYEVFNISSSDYHNELYGYLEDVDEVKLNGLQKSKNGRIIKQKKQKLFLWQHISDTQFTTLKIHPIYHLL